MRKIIVTEWLSLDGVFDADNMDQWWNPYDSLERQELIRQGMSGCDVYLLGRTTYQMLAPFWSGQKDDKNGPAAWLNSVQKYVVSSTMKKAEWNNSIIIAENVIEAITRLKQAPGKDILVSGSATLVQSLMQAGLIDELRLLVQPVIAGKGKRFFMETMPATRLKLVSSQTIKLGVVALTFQLDDKKQ